MIVHQNTDIAFLEFASSEPKPIMVIAIVIISYYQLWFLDSKLGFFDVVRHLRMNRQVSLIGILGHSNSDAVTILGFEDPFD